MAHKRDRAFKDLAELDPRGALHMFGSLALHAAAEVRLLERETSLPALRTDQVFHIKDRRGTRLEHYECLARYHSSIGERIGRYGMALALAESLPAFSTLVLLSPKGAPRVVPEQAHLEYGGLQVMCRYRVIKMWEMDPAPVIALGRPELLAWVPLMRHDGRCLEEAAEKLRNSRNLDAATRFLLLGSTRYNRGELARMLGRLGEMIPLKFYRQSWILQDERKEAAAEGRAEGLAEGRAKAHLQDLHRSIHEFLAARFPSVRGVAAVARCTDIPKLQRLRRSLYAATTAEAARKVLQEFRDAPTPRSTTRRTHVSSAT